MTEETDLTTEIMGTETVETVEAEKPIETPAEKPVEKEPEKKVDYGALHEERERRKEWQRKAQEEAERYTKLEDRFTKILESVAPKKEEEYVDPIEELRGTVKQVVERIDSVTNQHKASNEDAEKENRFIARYRASAAAFSKDVPEFTEAYNYLVEDQRKIFVKAFGEEKGLKKLATYEREIAEAAYEDEKNPAAVLHDMALERGFKKKEPVKTLENIEKSIDASKSLGSGGQPDSGGGLERLSPKEINDLSDEEFERQWKEFSKKHKR